MNTTNNLTEKLLIANSHCQKCSVNSLCLPAGLSSDELNNLENIIASSQITDKNKILFSVGADFTHLYVVHSGMFKTMTIDENGKERIINFHLPGEIMGLDGIHSSIYQSSAMALTMSSFCKIPFDALLDVSENHPIIQKNLLKLMSKEIYNCKQSHLDIGSRAKLALFIKNISQRFETRGYSRETFFLPISQRDIANYLGMADETLSRAFRKLQEQKVVKYNKHMLTILDNELLCEVIDS